MAHAIHPNFADKHEGRHQPKLNGGMVVKEHCKQRYATSAVTEAVSIPVWKLPVRNLPK